jgi:uncharacterized protein
VIDETPAGLVCGVPFMRIRSTPTSAKPEEESPLESPLRRAIRAGLLDAGVRGQPVAALWTRPRPEEPLQVMVSGAPSGNSTPDHASRGTPLLFPLGATGDPLSGDELSRLVLSIDHWVPCGGRAEPVRRDQAAEGRWQEHQWNYSPFDDLIGYMTHQAFAWLVYCEPLTAEMLQKELDQSRRALFRLRQSRLQSEADALEAERHEAWFHEVSRVGVGGLWDVYIWAGSSTAVSSQALAAAFCSAAEQTVPFYRIRPLAGERRDADGTSCASAVTASPFRATADLVSALVRPPETELPGLNLVAPPMFDTTPERRPWTGPEVEIGIVLDRFLRPSGPFTVPLSTLNRHTFVCGATGGGKSQTVRAMLEQLSRAPDPIPWLVIEPAKAEYARMAGRLDGASEVLVIAPGDPAAVPGSLNPLEPASLESGNPDRTFPLQSHADLVRALFMAAFQADEPFPQVISRALVECYEAAGWDLVTGEPLARWDAESGQPQPNLAVAEAAFPRYPTLGALQRMAWEIVGKIGYDEEIRRRVQGFVDVRIGSLRLGTPGRFFEGGHPLDVSALLRRNVVLEIENVTNDQDKAFLMGAVLIRLYEQLMLEEKERFAREESPPRLRHVVVVEEAHRLLRNVTDESPASHALELFAGLLAEVRAYGEGVVVAEQIPNKLIPDVIKNTALKVVHRLPAADDRMAVGATINLSDAQSQYIVTLEPGTAAVFADGMDHPLLGRMPSGENRESAKSVGRLPPLLRNGRRSKACGASCVSGTPCTLRGIRRAELLLKEYPELTFWVEVSCAAHEAGSFPPGLADTPSLTGLRQLFSTDTRLVECAIAHAVERAIGARYEMLQHFYDPDGLGHHLSVAAALAIKGTGLGDFCKGDDGRWRAGRQRFADIEQWLQVLTEDTESPIRSHAEIMTTAAQRGLALVGGDSATGELAYLRSLPWRRHVGKQQIAILVGTAETPVFRQAADSLIGPIGSSDERVASAFTMLTWGDPAKGERLRQMMCPSDPKPEPQVTDSNEEFEEQSLPTRRADER